MARDARAVLNMKRKQQQQQPFNLLRQRRPMNQIRDARQLLKLKKLQGIQKSKLTRQNFQQNLSRNQRPFNRPFVQNFMQQGSRKNGMNNVFNPNRPFYRNNFAAKVPNKRVQVAESGNLKITSQAQNQSRPIPRPSNNMRFVSNLSGLTVTTRTKPLQNQMLIEEVDNGDELERMTLQDIPEIGRMRDVPQSMLIQKKAPIRWELPSSSKSTLFGRLAKSIENTMVADSLSSCAHIKQPCWKVVVTNLQSSVTYDDIVELFGHVGSMKSVEILQPGMAVVEYFSKEDASKAHEMYHNRLLDGYPMQCVIQPPSRSTVTARLGERFEPTSSASAQSRTPAVQPHASRRVAFTVQLP